jgi:DNA-binding MarR family transcriptional regulator
VNSSSIPLFTLLSHALVAFTIELDNEWERQLLASKRPRIFLLSLVMWANYIRFLPPDGLAADELELLAQHEVDLNGLTRWRYVTVAPDPAATSKVPRREWIVRPTDDGRFAQELWRPLPDLVEGRWRDRYGAAKLETLDRRLGRVIDQFGGGRTPLYLPDVTSRNEMFTEAPAPPPDPRPDSSLPLFARLSRALLEFTLDFEKESDVALPIAANTLRVLGADPTPMRDVPALAGVSKEGTVQALTVLHRHGLAVVEPIPHERGKQVRLTADGDRARAAYHRVVNDVEDSWRSRFGDKVVSDLKKSLAPLVGSADLASSPLMKALDPPPGTWRATRPIPNLLPYHPMVIGRGGWPDAS